ncbi:hypothetical protein WICPIJ_004325 [Wickerhamomyces pijperi]|uniref:Uncharacterized protein n=1 Tax=Wickerhamomyces pijperi TaxID=599730 RepID=A0A9P8Q7V6_WICPI|nr:hypothetical protein WICPIJ_004325 [Wickerhamomyces pijperi]
MKLNLTVGTVGSRRDFVAVVDTVAAVVTAVAVVVAAAAAAAAAAAVTAVDASDVAGSVAEESVGLGSCTLKLLSQPISSSVLSSNIHGVFRWGQSGDGGTTRSGSRDSLEVVLIDLVVEWQWNWSIFCLGSVTWLRFA